jgi:hypothetical protein
MAGPGFFQDSGNSALTDLPVITEGLAFDVEYDNGNSATNTNIDWTRKNKQKITLTDSPTLTFTVPDGPSNMLLRVVQDATGSRVITWPTIKWPNGGTEPTLSTAAGAIDIITLYYDGSAFYGNASQNFV